MASSGRDRFSSLPSELLGTIINYVHEKRDLNVICRVSKLFHKLALPLLYESLEIAVSEELEPQADALKPFSTSWPPAEFTSGLRHVRELALTTTFRTIVDGGRRCWHGPDDEESESDYSADADEFDDDPNDEMENQLALPRVSERDDDKDDIGDEEEDDDVDDADRSRPLSQYEEYFRKFCQGLSDNSLRSFRWELGACLPGGILSPDGHFTQYQIEIEKLSLITDGTYDDTISRRKRYDLSKLGRIRHFSWIGAQSFEDLSAIKQCLSTNAKHLETLRIELIDWREAADDWHAYHTRFTNEPTRRANFLAEDILDSTSSDEQTSRTVSFPILQELSLGLVSFQSGSGLLTNRLNMFRLKRLSLFFCPVVSHLLKSLAESKQDLSLLSFELNCRDEYADSSENVERAIIGFLKKVTGLQTLCLSLPARILFPNDIVEVICRCQRSLKRVVLHSESEKLNLGIGIREPDESLGYVYYSTARFLFKKSTCEMIAVQSDPCFMQPEFKHYYGDIDCKLLHLRASQIVVRERGEAGPAFRKELDDFADWIFQGEKGFEHLQVLAYGDFAFPESCGEYNVLYCRKDPDEPAVNVSNWEILTPAKKKLWSWVQDNLDFLSACPHKSIFPA